MDTNLFFKGNFLLIFPLAAWDNSSVTLWYGNMGGGARSLRRQEVYQVARFQSVGIEKLRQRGDIPVA
jgi:hypothetical protein